MRPNEQKALRPILTPEEIGWLIPFGDIRELNDGDFIYQEQVQSNSFYAIIEGEVRVTRQVAGKEMFLAVHGPGSFTGELSVITGDESLVTCVALGNTKVLHLPVSRFADVMRSYPELMTQILPVLARRGPAILAIQTEREKLAALGTLAAGFAHELNNPASAAVRSASLLTDAILAAQEACTALFSQNRSPEELSFVKEMVDAISAQGKPKLNPLEHSDIENAVGEKLEGLGAEDPWDAAASLVDSGFGMTEIARLEANISPALVLPSLNWIAATHKVKALVDDVQNSTCRVSELVQTIKNYSQMDQAPLQQIDVHTGIESTIQMLEHAIKSKSITVKKAYGANIPKITAYAGELNQVWTNLIDNAIDAMPTGGTLSISTRVEGDRLRVDVEDDGPGISSDVLPRIFEPFFTTKRTGEGTGLGLDISYKIVVDHHAGDIFVVSEPGKTVFIVRLPLSETQQK